MVIKYRLTLVSECSKNVALNKLDCLFQYLLIEKLLLCISCVVKNVYQVDHCLFFLFFELKVLLRV